MIYNDIERFISLKPAYYRFLKSMNLTRNISQEGCSRFDVEIILSKISDDNIENLQIRCTKAFDISIGDVESMYGLHIDIEDVRSRQLEGGIYRVTEQEGGAFSFYCDAFFVELIK